MKNLYQTLSARNRPEDVAQMILDLNRENFSSTEINTLNKATKYALKNSIWAYSSMAQEFGEAVGAAKQVQKAIEIFQLNQAQSINTASAASISQFINEVSEILHKKVGENNFKTHRLNKNQRKNMGMEISKRSYNKKWRILKHLEAKLDRFVKQTKYIEFQKVAKHGLVHHLSEKEFCADPNTAFFIAYYNARCNLRSIFTNGKQERPFDEICQMLFNRCINSKNTNWFSIAHIYTQETVLSQLSDKQKGELLGIWTNMLSEISNVLQDIWQVSNINRESMVVRKGNDSSRWNATAGAWNKARDQWMNLIYGLGLEAVLDDICFGKTLRLMAADVAFWHKATGGKLEPNTFVWNQLPLPWEVFQGKLVCNKEIVIAACKRAKLDAYASGWLAPKQHGIATFKPTPELVHGVQIHNPFLAKYLKSVHAFSGKPKQVFELETEQNVLPDFWGKLRKYWN